MKKKLKVIISFILILSLLFVATSCDTLDGIIGIFDKSTEQGTGGAGGSGGTDTESGQGGTDGNNTVIKEDNCVITPDFAGGVIYLPSGEDPITSDPYLDVDVEAFYADYTPAVSYMDSYYRTLHNLMSGDIGEQDQEPTVSSFQPVIGGEFVRNTTYIYSENGNTYYVIDSNGNIVNEIYKGGAYIMLEEVAAYVFAFGEPPVNHSYSKRTSPTSSPWGEYLRVNHTKFSGSTTKYPYEPKLPNISGCGGDLTYYEMDIGTTGTDCDPSYTPAIYNEGTRIERGAARIVYTRSDYDGDGVVEIDETYLFYTYNHYNDFQEYLNYEGGWGEMFGNITGGGKISSKSDYNPTPYVNVVYASFVNSDGSSAIRIGAALIAWIPSREEI